MMNKLQSAKLHLVKFLFIVPLLAVILISFRQKKQDPSAPTEIYEMNISATTDTVPVVTEPNEKGYIINIKDNNGNCTIVIKDKNDKEVESLLLTKWNENEKYYEEKYGEIRLAPPTPKYLEGTVSREVFLQRNPDVKMSDGFFIMVIQFLFFILPKTMVVLKVMIWIPRGERERFEKKYGKIPYPTPPPTPPVPPIPCRPPAKLPDDVKSIDGNDER